MMNNMDDNMVTSILIIVLMIMFFILMVLSITFVILKLKQKMSQSNNDNINLNKPKPSNTKKKTAIDNSYSKQSILDFMEFDDIQDNMIIQKSGKRFLMVVECQGVNYDLMSQMEKVAVEEGFQQFLNTLRHPIQIYIQTRSVNLESSISTYQSRLKDIEDKLNKMQYRYDQMKESNSYTEEQLEKYFYEITKQKNLYEYGKDIISNTEKMNKNKNVLTKNYYIVVPYYSEEAGDEKYDNEEIKNMAFSELYTKSQAIIRTLSACSVGGRILNSRELIDLLYVAYNRDEAETYGIDKAIRAGYNELYSTSRDVFEKKINALDKEIEDRAIDLANKKVDRAKSILEENAEKKEENIDEFVENLARIILQENEDYLGKEVTQLALNDEGGEGANEKVKKSTRGRKRKSDK